MFLEVGEALKELVRQDGIAGLWKGLFPTLLRDVPFSAIYWMNYETIKAFFGPGVPSFGFSFLAGAAAGCVSVPSLRSRLRKILKNQTIPKKDFN